MSIKIKKSSAAQYEKLQLVGAMLPFRQKFIDACPILGGKRNNYFLEHPCMDNTVVMTVMGNEDDYYFGVMLDKYMTCDNGKIVNLPEMLNMSWALKMSKDSKGNVGNRGFLVHNVDKRIYGKSQVRIEELIYSIKKYGYIVPMHLNLSGYEIHHNGYPFDCRISNLQYLTTEEHEKLHDEIGHHSHSRVIEAVADQPIPDFM